MKNLTLYFLVIVFSYPAGAQSLEEKLNLLQSSVEKVMVKDIEYDQQLTYKKSSGYIISIAISESKRGKVTQYSFNLFDLEKNKIKFDTKKNVAVVEIGTKSDKKVIKNVVDNKLGSYLNKITIRVSGVEAARSLHNQLKAVIAEAEKSQPDFFPKKTDLAALLSFLEKQVGKVKINNEVFEQSFSFDNDNNVIVTFASSDVNKSARESMTLNFGDVNLRRIDFITKGNKVYVEAETTGKKNLIEHVKNGEISGFKNKLSLKANNIEAGRKLAAALVNLKELADQHQKELFDPNANWENTNAYLQTNIKKVSRNDDIFEQTISKHSGQNQQLVFEISDKNRDKTSRYLFNPSDLNGAKIDFTTKGTNIVVDCETKGKKSLIQYHENSELGNYKNTFDIYTESIEQARALKKALVRLVQLSNEKNQEFLIKGKKDPEVKESLDYLIQNITDVSLNDKTYKQSLFYEENKPEIITLELIDVDKDIKLSYELNLKDLNESKVGFNTRGREVLVEAEVKGKQDLIKSTKNDEDDKFLDKLSIKAKGIEEARIIVQTLRYLVNKLNS